MKSRPVARTILTIVFLGLLAVPLIVKWRTRKAAAADARTTCQIALKRYGFCFKQVAQQDGINFVHEAPVLDAKLDRIMPEVASMGASVSIVDYNQDGWPDIYVTNSRIGSMNHLYRNNGNGTFTDVAPKLGIANVNQPGTGVSMGAVWGDYDNDGYPDLFLIKWGKPELFHNDNGHGFTLVKNAGLPAWMNANTALWFDYDDDGKLDLFVGGYYPSNLNLWHLKTTKIMPNSFEYASNGGRKYLFHNLGNGHFKEVSAQAGIRSNRWALASAAAPLDGNRYPDLFIANDYGVSELYINNHGHFHEAGKQTGVGFAPKSGMNASFGDIFNDGKFSIYVSNISQEGVLIQGNNLWVPDPGRTLHYQNMASALGVELGGWSFGAQFGDFSNDGRLDLFLQNGYISASKTRSYWYDFSKVAGGNSSIISDASHWPAFDGRSLSGYQEKKVWINDGAGKFENVARAVGVNDRYDGRAVALADLWNNGALDAVVANQNGPLLIYKDIVAPGNDWIEFRLHGTRSNRSAIGATVELYWDGQKQIQAVSGGNGFASENELRLHFGLGKNPHIDKAVIRWPSGTVQTIRNLTPNKLYNIEEPE